MPGPWAGSATDKRPARERSPRVPVTRFELPAPVPLAGDGLESRSQDLGNDLPYLDRPLLPLAVALPRMLMEIETQLANETAGASNSWRPRQRAELIRSLLARTREGSPNF